MSSDPKLLQQLAAYVSRRWRYMLERGSITDRRPYASYPVSDYLANPAFDLADRVGIEVRACLGTGLQNSSLREVLNTIGMHDLSASIARNTRVTPKLKKNILNAVADYSPTVYVNVTGMLTNLVSEMCVPGCFGNASHNQCSLGKEFYEKLGAAVKPDLIAEVTALIVATARPIGLSSSLSWTFNNQRTTPDDTSKYEAGEAELLNVLCYPSGYSTCNNNWRRFTLASGVTREPGDTRDASSIRVAETLVAFRAVFKDQVGRIRMLGEDSIRGLQQYLLNYLIAPGLVGNPSSAALRQMVRLTWGASATDMANLHHMIDVVHQSFSVPLYDADPLKHDVDSKATTIHIVKNYVLKEPGAFLLAEDHTAAKVVARAALESGLPYETLCGLAEDAINRVKDED